MWMWWFGLLACNSGPDSALIAQQLTSADAAQAMATLTALPPQTREPLATWQTLAQQAQDLEPQRQAVQQAERQMLLDAAVEALRSPHPAAAGPSIEAGLQRNPQDPEFKALLQQFLAAADLAAPGDAAEMFWLMATLHPDVAEQHRERAIEAQLAVRYAPDAIQKTREMQQGARLEAAVHLLGQLEAEYYSPPDWSRLTEMARRRLFVLSSRPEVQSALPSLVGVPWPTVERGGMDGAVAHLTACVQAAEAAGAPTEVVVVEWMDAVVTALDDWTQVVWPAEIAAWQSHHDGVRHGVGLSLHETEAGSVFVNRPQLDTPAWSSDLHQGDRVDRIVDEGGALVLADLPAGERLAAAEAALLGDTGTEVMIEVTRLDQGVLQVTLQRGPVKLETVHGYTRQDNNDWQMWLDEAMGLAYVRLLTFRDHTEPDFDALLEPLKDDIKGLLLDLRGNPGGDLNAAIQISDRFVADGILADLTGRHPRPEGDPVDPVTGEPLIPWNHALSGDALEGVSVVVLVDQDTASAAEVLAGVLQERVNALVVGAPTWGKGYTQVLRTELELGYAVQFTHRIWTLPSGRHLVHGADGGGGLIPDVPLSLSPGEKFQVDLLARQRAALRTHQDGTALQWMDVVRRADMPPLPADPALQMGQLVLHALVHQTHPPQ